MPESRKDQLYRNVAPGESRLSEEIGWDDEAFTATYRRFADDGVTVLEERPATDDDLRELGGLSTPWWGQDEGQAQL